MKPYSFALAICAVACFAAGAFAQQIATTSDGRKVTLHSDGTWKYVSESAVTLKLEAGIVYQIGGPEPVARTTFYLLDSFPLEEMDKLPPAKSVTTDFIARCGSAPESARELIAKHIVYKLTTGFDGKGELSGIKPGRYWIFGGSTLRRGCALWIQPVDLTRSQTVTLDQSSMVNQQ
ncbi:MAG: DUF3157 family protein [Acidobacteria bacterium]|nr:DUF3157 family protein [Acidobacteriota bacterium]